MPKNGVLKANLGVLNAKIYLWNRPLVRNGFVSFSGWTRVCKVGRMQAVAFLATFPNKRELVHYFIKTLRTLFKKGFRWFTTKARPFEARPCFFLIQCQRITKLVLLWTFEIAACKSFSRIKWTMFQLSLGN